MQGQTAATRTVGSGDDDSGDSFQQCQSLDKRKAVVVVAVVEVGVAFSLCLLDAGCSSTFMEHHHGWILVMGSHSNYLNFKLTDGFTFRPFFKTSIPARVPRGGPTATQRSTPGRMHRSHLPSPRHRNIFCRVVCMVAVCSLLATQRLLLRSATTTT